MANPMVPYSFLFPIAAKVLELIGSPLVQGAKLAWGMKDDLQKLRNTITFVHAVLLDADQKQYQDGNHHQLKVWMGELRNALYQADDLLNDLLIHSIQQHTPHRSLLKGKVRPFFSPRSNPLVFRFKTIWKIKKLREKFDDIAADRNNFGLIERIVERNVVIARDPTHSFVDESGFIGRGVFKKAIIGCCLNTTFATLYFNYRIRGIGKTTLVQTVYQDKRVIDNFDLRIWVCISDTFVLAKIILDILKSTDSASESANYMHLGIDQLQLLLRQKLQGKKYLLVLDDAWNEERDKWIELMNLLTADGLEAGSKVIVTARSELVSAALAPRACTHRLEGLSDDDCLSILLMWAFAKRQDAERFPRLIEIGRQIVKKCKGNPLAVRTLGKLLFTKTEEREWLYVRDNDVWDSGQGEGDIMPALKLSYYQLPSHLKQCLAFSSLFPKDFVFLDVDLVEIWSAQGLIRSEQFKTLQATGKDYLGLLTSRGFFQICNFYLSGWSYTMHDLVHDLAESVAKPDCISTASSYPLLHSSVKLQHLSIIEDDTTSDVVLTELLESQPQLRSFLLFQRPHGSHSSFDSFIGTSISKLKLLRVLQLYSFSGNKLPKSIGSLWNLRYLDLSVSRIKSLPYSVCNLVCLEVLRLGSCEELEKLPVGLGKLIHLKTLVVTTKEKCLPDKEFRSLTSLQRLWIVNCVNMESVLSGDVMKCLSSLHTLHINRCNNLLSLPANGIRDLHKLENLFIQDCEKLNLQLDDQHRNCEGGRERGLHTVRLRGLPMLEILPSWLLHGANALKEILIEGCPNFTTLMPSPLLENLERLEQLYIGRCPELKSLPIGMHHLTALTGFFGGRLPTTGQEMHKRYRRGLAQNFSHSQHIPGRTQSLKAANTRQKLKVSCILMGEER